MINNKKVILYIVGTIFLILLSIYLFSGNNEFKQVELPQTTNKVINSTEVTYLDTLTYLALNQVDVELSNVMVTNLHNNAIKNAVDGMELEAFVLDGGIGNYIVFVNPNKPRARHIEIMAHEAVHIEQYQTGRLEQIDSSVFVYEGDTVDANTLHYNDYEWEKEAFERQKGIADSIKKIVW